MICSVEMISDGMTHTRFHDDWFRHSSNINGNTSNNLRGSNTGITDERDLIRRPLKCTHVA
jgi:hypothetical protein